MKEQWKKQMQQKMADYRESDIEVSWAELEEALAANRRQTKTLPLWGRRMAAAAAILLVAGAGFWLLRQTEPAVQHPALTQEVSTPKAHPAANVSAPMEPAERLVSQAVSRPVRQPVANIVPVTESYTQEASEPEQPAVSVAPESPAETVEPTAKADSTTTHHPSKATGRRDSGNPITYHPTPITHHPTPTTHHPSPITAKLYLSNTMGGGSSLSNSSIVSMGYYIMTTEKVYHTVEMNEANGYAIDAWYKEYSNNIVGPVVEKSGTNYVTQITDTIILRRVNGPVHVDEDIHHHQPVRVGLSLRYRLNNRWGIESGLTYTHHSSDMTMRLKSEVGETLATTEQRLVYLGIPVNMSYQLWATRHFNFYVSAGGMVEKMVKGTQTSEGQSFSVSIHPLQCSVNGAVGAEWMFLKDFSLYAEPSLGYYFDNGSRISTFYQEKPLNFNVNVGLRFNIQR